MEILPLDGAHGVDHVRLCGGGAVGGGVCGVYDGGEWDARPPLCETRQTPLQRRDAAMGERERERERERGWKELATVEGLNYPGRILISRVAT